MEKVSWRLTKSIMVLVMIVLLLCSLLLGYVLISLRSSLLNASYVATEIIDQNLNSRLMELRKYSLTLELSSSNSQIKRLSSLSESNASVLYELVNQIQSFKYLNPLIEGIFIYYPNLDWIVGNVGSYTAKSYYVLDNALQPKGFEELMRAIGVGNTEVMLVDNGGYPLLYYRKQMLYQGKLVGYILIRLNIDQILLSPQRNIKSTKQDFAFGLSLNGKKFAASGNTELFGEETEKQQHLDGPYFLNRSLLLQTRSTLLQGLSYQLYFPLSEQLKPASLALKICIGAMIFISLLALVVAMFLGKRNTRPLMQLLQQVGADDQKSSQDAYTLLSMRIDELLQEKDDKIRALQYQREAMGPLFLHHLLSGRVDSEQAATNLLRRYNINFDYPFFVIGVIRAQHEDTPNLFNYLLESVRTQQLDILATEKDGDILILYTSDEYLDYANTSALLASLVEDNLLFKRAKATLGTWHDQFSEAMQSYHEALLLLDNAPIGVWWYQQEDKDCSSLLLQSAKDAVLGNQLPHALVLLEELAARYTPKAFETPFAQAQINEMERKLLFLLQQAEINPIQEITEVLSFQRCLLYVHTLVNKQEDNESESELSIAERAAAIVDSDFTDPQLGLYRIADELKLSNSYLSTVFKAKYQIGIVQFINQKRIELAKELIVNTGMSIKEIAAACGFSSDISFIRVFKRYEDKTPGTFRKS